MITPYTDPAFLAQFLYCMREAVAETDPDAQESSSSIEEEEERLVAAVICIVWCMLLARDATTGGSMIVTAIRLDDAMLPPGVTNDEISEMSGGLSSGPLARSTLRKLKLLMSPGKILPDPIVQILAEHGIAVY